MVMGLDEASNSYRIIRGFLSKQRSEEAFTRGEGKNEACVEDEGGEYERSDVLK